MVVRKTFLEPSEICGCSLTGMIKAKGSEGWVAVLLAVSTCGESLTSFIISPNHLTTCYSEKVLHPSFLEDVLIPRDLR